MPEPQATPVFGRYQDPVILGAGGMGTVYRAVDPSLDRYVAIKVLTAREPKYLERFRREAQVLAKIMHPSIIQIYEIVGSDEDASDPYIVMEYFEGKPLDGLLKSLGRVPAPQVMNVLRQTAEGLKKAHANNVIHRDIKPANIMVAENGDVKILDFGIAKLRDAKKDLTGNTVLGTPYYMSPEQAMGQPIDNRTDLYSLGITAFHLLSGKKPFEAKSKVDVMLAQVKTPLPNIHDFVMCDERVARIVEKMCAKQPSQRFQNCDELMEALDALPKSLGGRQVEDTQPEIRKAAPRASQRIAAQALPTPPRREQTPPAPKVSAQQRTPPKPTGGRPSSRPDGRKTPAGAAARPKRPQWVAIAAGAGGALLALIVIAILLSRGGGSASGPFRVPGKGWSSPGPNAPALKQIQAHGGYGNCVFSSRQLERGKEDPGAVRTLFSASEPIHGRCYFARQIGPNKPGEVWQELWIDGVKRAQVIYDPALANDEDQLALEVSRRHGSRLAELSSGKHTLDIWIYRQAEDADAPEPLAAGELVVRK
jgi:serine/threonine-protein kinase